MTTPSVLVIGLGRMGLPMAANLVRAGYGVVGVDARPDVRAAAEHAGVRWGASAAAEVGAADVVMTVLPGSPELRDLMFGTTERPGLLDRLAPTSDWLDCTSAAPDLASALAERASLRGIDHLDCGLGGGPDQAREATLTLYIGGPADVLERHRGLLAAVASPDRLHHMGASGSGYLTKLLVNLLWFGQSVATAEALLLGAAGGIPRDRLAAALAGSAASSEYLRTVLPKFLDGDRMASFGLDRCVEELDSLERAARDGGVPFDLSAVVARLHRDALEEFGPVDGELLAAAHLERRAGIATDAGGTSRS